MWFSRFRNLVLGRRSVRWPGCRHSGVRLVLEQLEDRLVPSNYTAGSVTQLIADINAANQQGGANTITLVAGTTFTLTAVNNTTNGEGGFGQWPADGAGGNGFGGGLYAAGGEVTMEDGTVTGNAGNGGYSPVAPGMGEGGGLYIATSAAVSLDAFTLANVLNNTASTSDPNIDGSYTLIS
jgi:hypothetical protein